MVSLCKQNNIKIISDEVHGDLVLGENKFNSLSDYLKENDNISRLVSSKEVEMIGKSVLRVGMDKPQISKILKCSFFQHKNNINGINKTKFPTTFLIIPLINPL